MRSILRSTQRAIACIFTFGWSVQGLAQTPQPPPPTTPFVVRYTSAGAVDTTYAVNGYAMPANPSPTFAAFGGSVSADGRVVIGGVVQSSPGPWTFMSGDVAPTGTTIKTGSWPLGPNPNMYAVGYDAAIDSQGRTVIAGMGNPSGGVFALYRLTAAGTTDTSFNGYGFALSNFTSCLREEAFSVAIAPGDKPVIAGFAIPESSRLYNFAIARYTPEGQLDKSFAGDGKQLTLIDGCAESAGRAVTVDRLGRTIVVGQCYQADDTTTMAVARYKLNGDLDRTFSDDGMLTIDFTTSPNEFASSVVVDANNVITVGGSAFLPDAEQFALARILENGTLDKDFDRDGKVLTDFATTYSETISDLALTGGGRVIAIGSAKQVSSTSWLAAARYNANGSLDDTYDGDGKVLTNTPGYAVKVGNAGGVDSSGRLYIIGMAGN